MTIRPDNQPTMIRQGDALWVDAGFGPRCVYVSKVTTATGQPGGDVTVTLSNRSLRPRWRWLR